VNPSLSRRRFLGGAAVAIALPPFESLLSKAQAQPDLRRRLVTVFLPVGMLMEEWTPSTTGPLQLSGLAAGLEKVKSKILILSHLANLSGKNRPGDHAAGTGAVFNCAKPAKGDGDAIRAGVSVDQVAAKQLRAFTPIPSLQLGMFPLPYNKAGQKPWVAAAVGEEMGVSSKTKHAEEAKKFVAFWSRPDIMKLYLDAKKAYPAQNNVTPDLDPAAAEMLPALQAGSYNFLDQKWPVGVQDVMLKDIQSVFGGTMTIDQMLKDMDTTFAEKKSTV